LPSRSAKASADGPELRLLSNPHRKVTQAIVLINIYGYPFQDLSARLARDTVSAPLTDRYAIPETQRITLQRDKTPEI